MSSASRQRLSQNSPIFKDFENLMKDMERVDANLSVQSVPDKVILLLGQTKAGKTTLMYYLLGKKLIRFWSEEVGLYHMKPEAKIFDALIGNTYESATVYPNIPTEVGEDKVLIIDMPGFSDTRYIYRLLNIYIIREVIKKIRSVHASLVVPYETLGAEYLASTIERNCLLLNNRLVSTPGCISFILTKVEDKESDLNAFKEFMELLKQERKDDALEGIITTLQDAKIYIFENTDPKVELGVALKSRIVAENRFFQTDEKPENLLSQSYADIIAGSQEPQQFSNFVIDLLGGVEQTFTLLVGLFSQVVQLHHIPEFNLIYALKELNQQTLIEEITTLAKEIHVGGISALEIVFNENCKPVGQEEGLLNLAKKFYRPQKDELNMDVQIFKGSLDSFIEWSGVLLGEQSRVSLELRKQIHELFKFCSKVSRTISHIKQSEIIAKFETYCKAPEILTAIENYNNLQRKNDLIVRIAQSEFGAGKLAQIQEFKQILYSVSPNFTFEDFEEVIEKVKVTTRDKIMNKKLLSTLETTKQVQAPPHRTQQAKPISIPSITRDAINTIKSIPLEYTHLKTLFSFILNFKPDFEKANNDLNTEFGMALFRKTAQLLERLQLYEESILFYLAIPSEIEAEYLIEVALNFGEISKDFIRDILLPYYSSWNPNFLMVERLFNYLTLSIYDPAGLYENQLSLADMLEKMHNTKQEQLPFLKRFELGLVEGIYTEGEYRNHFLERARRSEERLKRSKVTGLSKELSTLRLC